MGKRKTTISTDIINLIWEPANPISTDVFLGFAQLLGIQANEVELTPHLDLEELDIFQFPSEAVDAAIQRMRKVLELDTPI